ncbi:hypothetical protein D3C71_1260970 [compost metagenome]
MKRSAHHVGKIGNADNFFLFRVQQGEIKSAALLVKFGNHAQASLPARGITVAFIPNGLPGLQKLTILGVIIRQTPGITLMHQTDDQSVCCQAHFWHITAIAKHRYHSFPSLLI